MTTLRQYAGRQYDPAKLFGGFGLSQAGARSAGWAPPEITDQGYLAARKANPSNPWMVGPQQRQALDLQRTAWDSQFAPGGRWTSLGQATFGMNPVSAKSYRSDWGAKIEDDIAAKMASIPMSQGGWAEPKGTGLSGPFGGLLGAAFSLATGNPWLLAALNAAKGGIQGGPMGALTGGATSFLPSPIPTLRKLAGR